MSRNDTHNPALSSCLRALLRRPPAALALLAPGIALAGPTGEDVIRGSAQVTRPDDNSTVINQFTQRAVINWQTFNVDADEYVLFNQPDSSSVVLNRVLGGDPSYILGLIEANGQVFLLNPQGVYFTHGASLDVQGFLGSTLDMDPDAFMAGDYTLTRSDASPASAQVINDGVMTAGPGGYIVLAGDYTENTGIITANAGSIALVSGNALTLDIEGDGLVNFAVDEATLSEVAGVRNAGSLIADGGRVVMTARVANALVATAVNNEGLVRAHSIEEQNGEIHLVGFGGNVENHGTLDADGENADGGGIGIYSDRDITLADGAVQTAAGDASHAGGAIRVVAEQHLDYQQDNLIRATGGNGGGFVEVSGHGGLSLSGVPLIGAGGAYVIDPAFLNIGISSGTSSVTIANVVTQLNANVDVTLVASSSVNAIAGSISAAGSGDLTIGIGTVSPGSGSCTGPGLALCLGGVVFTPGAGGTVNLSSLDINIAGDLTINAGSTGTVTTADLATTGGTIKVHGDTITTGAVDASGNVEIGSSIAQAGQVTVNGNLGAGGDVDVLTDNISGTGITINGAIDAVNVTLHATGSSGASADVNVSGLITATGIVDVLASGSMDGGNVNLSGIDASGDIFLNAHNSTGGGASINAGNLAGNNIFIQTTHGGNSGGNVSFGAVNAAGSFSVNANGGSSTGGNITGTGNITAGTSILLHANGNGFNSDGNINVSGVLAGSSISLNAQGGSSGDAGNITIGGAAGGTFGAIANGDMAGGNITVTGNLAMSGTVSLTANAGSSSGGSASVAGMITGTNVTIHSLANTGTGNADIFVGGGIDATGNVTVMAMVDPSGSADAQITVNGDLLAGGDLLVDATGGSLAGATASLTINGNVEAGGNADIYAGAVTADSIFIDGNVDVGGDLWIWNRTNGNVEVTGSVIGSGEVRLEAYGTTSSQGRIDVMGDIKGDDVILFTSATGANGGSISVGDIDANGMVDIDATGANAGDGDITVGDITATGVVMIDAVHGDQHSFGDISARHINAHFTPYAFGNVNVTMGLLHVNGTTAGNRDIVVSLDSFSGNLNGTLDIAGAQAENGGISLHANAASGSASINVTGAMSARRFIDIQARNNVATGNLTVNNPTGLADVFVTAGVGAPGDIVVNGNITVSGRATSNDPNAASVHLDATGFNTNDITVTGGISVTAAARAYTGAGGSITGSDTGTFTSDGNQGIAGIRVATQDGTVNLGNVNVTAVGQALVEVHALNVDVGNVTVNVADGSFERVSTLSYCDSMSCAISRTETMTAGAMADVRFFYTGSTPNGSATFGNIDINAGGGRVDLRGYLDVSGGGIAIDARGNAFTVESSGTVGADTIDYAESANGGGAGVNIETIAAGGSVTLSNAVNLSAPGNASLRILADTIALDDIELVATAGTFTRAGTPAGEDHDGPFSGDGGGGPHIDEGTVTGGGASLHLSGYSSVPSSHAAADSIGIDGAVTLDGAGNAHANLRAVDVTVTGNLAVRSGYMQQDGSYSSTDTDTGASYEGSVVSSWGRAAVDINASGDVQIANLLIDGPTAGGQLEGGNIRAGAISITARGGSLEVTETETLSGVTTTLAIDAPNTLTGFGIHASNAVELTGAFTLDAVGVGGMVMTGATINTRDITINVTNADYTVETEYLFDGAETTFTAGGAILGIGGAVAQVNGNLTLNAGQQVHFGGAANVSGDFIANAGSGITRTIPAPVNFLNGLENEDFDSTIVLPAGFNVQAANISLLSAAGPVNLDGAVLNGAGGAVAISGGNVSLSGTNISGQTVQITASGNVTNSAPPGAITAGALAISAGGNVNLGNTVLTVGSGSIAGVNGDENFLRLLAGQGVDVPAGGPSLSIRGRNVTLGNLSVAGDYIQLQANALTLGGTVTTDTPALLQLAPFTANAPFTFEQSTAGGGVAYVYNVLDDFNASTIALGTTAHSGNVAIGAGGTVDIGDTNLFVLTTGTVLGLDRVVSSGVVKDLATLIGGEFDVPQTDEIDTRQDIVQNLNDEYALERRGDDDDEEGDEEGEDTDTDADVESDEDSLIRQDTVDEELMCQ